MLARGPHSESDVDLAPVSSSLRGSGVELVVDGMAVLNRVKGAAAEAQKLRQRQLLVLFLSLPGPLDETRKS